MYIIKTFEQFYVQADEKGWNEIYNPHVATQFKTKALAQEWMKTRTTFIEYAEFLKAAETIAEYDVWIAKGGIRRTMEYVDHEFSRKYDPKKDTAIDVLNWRLEQVTRPDHTVRQQDYQSWPQLYSVFTHIWGIESYRMDEGDELKSTFTVRTSRDGDFNKFKEELKIILPKVQIFEDDYKQLKIFDHELSEFDTYHLLYKNANDCKIVRNRWSQYPMVEGTLKTVFEYMKQERYYD